MTRAVVTREGMRPGYWRVTVDGVTVRAGFRTKAGAEAAARGVEHAAAAEPACTCSGSETGCEHAEWCPLAPTPPPPGHWCRDGEGGVCIEECPGCAHEAAARAAGQDDGDELAPEPPLFCKLVKVAMVRAEGWPVGVAAPLHLRCPCGDRPLTLGSAQPGLIVCRCGARYTGTGEVIE